MEYRETAMNNVYTGDYITASIVVNQHNENVLVIAMKDNTLETDEGNLEWDTVIALYAKDGVEPNRFEFTPQMNNSGVALFKMLAK
jgi:hypothetical protein